MAASTKQINNNSLGDEEALRSISGEVIDSDKSRFRTPDGLVLRLRRVPQMTIYELGRKVKPPKVPLVHDEESGKDLENPLDPEYVAAMTEYTNTQGITTFTAILGLGTVLETVPDNIAPLDSDEWVEVLEEIGISFNSKNKMLRYVAWLKFIVLNDDKVFTQLVNAVFRFSGFSTEADVQSAVDSFPSDTERSTANGLAVTPRG